MMQMHRAPVDQLNTVAVRFSAVLTSRYESVDDRIYTWLPPMPAADADRAIVLDAPRGCWPVCLSPSMTTREEAIQPIFFLDAALSRGAVV